MDSQISDSRNTFQWAGQENADFRATDSGSFGVMWYYESLANQWPAPPWATDSHRFVGVAKASRTLKSKFGTEIFTKYGFQVDKVQCRNCTIITLQVANRCESVAQGGVGH